MTTANLSVGIDTSKAKSDLALLRKEMAGALRGIAFELSTDKLVSDVQKAMSRRRFALQLDTTRMEEDVLAALKRLESKTSGRKIAVATQVTINTDELKAQLAGANFHVGIDSTKLIAEIRQAATVGLAGLNVSVGGAAGQALAPSGDIKAMVRGMITEATDEIIKAAPKLRRAARAGAEPGGAGDDSGYKAAVSYSSKNPETGATVRVSKQLENPTEALARVQASAQDANQQANSLAGIRVRRALRQQQVREEAQEQAEQQTNSAATVRLRRALRQQVAREEAQEQAEQQSNSMATVRLRRALRQQAGREEAQAAAEQQSNSMATVRLRRALRQQEAREESQALTEQQGNSAATLRLRRALRQQAVREETQEQAEQQSNAAATLRLRRALRQQAVREETQAQSEQQANSMATVRLRRALRQQAVKEEAQEQSEQQSNSAATLRLRRALRQQAVKEEAQASAEQQSNSAATLRLRRALRQQEAREESQALTEQQTNSAATLRLRRALRQQEAREESQALTQQQSNSAATLRLRRALRQQEAREESQALTEQQANSAATLRLRRALRQEEARALNEAMRATYDAAKFQAQGTGLSGKGVQVAGAKALVDRFGADQSRAFLGNRGFLVDEVSRLASFASGATRAVSSTKEMRNALNDAHSAARGLAGSLGQMWLTWGNTAPLVASAALGMALKSVFMIGKDVEFQLGFVSGLTGEAAVNVREFGAAMAGSMTPPKEAAEGLRALAQNGLNTVQALAALPDVINLAVAGEMKLADAALGATGILAAFNLGLSNMTRISDVFSKAAAISNTSVGGMVEAMKQASTVAGQYGLTVEQTAASLAVMAQRNIEGSAAGTALRNMISELAAPTKEAQRALKALGVDAFENGKMKDYSRLLEEVREKTIGLNQETRVKFYEVIFNERGAKAADAIISGLDNYKKKLSEIQNESKGFTASLTNILGDTTEGKVRKLSAEFQSLSMQAFPQAKTSVDALLVSLRNVFSDPSTQQGLANLITNVAGFVRLLSEYAGTIAFVGAAWMGYRLALGAVTSAQRLLTSTKQVDTAVQAAGAATTATATVATGAQATATGILAAAQRAATATTVALRTAVAGLGGAVGIATGGISIALGVLAAWGLSLLASRDYTDQVAAAQDNLKQSTIAATREMENQLKAAQAQGRFLGRVAQLRAEGMSSEGAMEKASKEMGSNSQVRTLQAQLQEQEKTLAKARAENTQPGRVSKGVAEALAAVEATKAQIRVESQLDAQRQANQGAERIQDQTTKLEAFNREVGAVAAKIPKALDLVLPADTAKLSADEFLKVKAEQERRLNDLREKRSIPSSKAEADARALANREQREELADMEFRRRLVETQSKLEDQGFAERLDALKAYHSEKLLSDQEFALREAAVLKQQADAKTAAIRKEQDEISAVLKANLKAPVEGLSGRLAAAKSPSDEIKSLLTPGSFMAEAPDKLLRLLERLDELRVKAAEVNSKATSAARAASLVAQGEMADLKKKFDAMNVDLASRDVENLFKLSQQASDLNISSGRGPGTSAIEQMYAKWSPTTEKMVVDGAERARYEQASKLRGQGAEDGSLKARMAVFDQYAPKIREVANEEARLQAELQRTADFLATPDAAMNVDGAGDAARARVLALQEQLAEAQAQVVILRARRDSSAEVQGQGATDIYNVQRSAAYGMDNFWRNYRKEATDSAKLVENVMSQSFSTVEQALLKFSETGKLNFKDMITAIGNDAMRLVTSQGIKQLLGLGAEKLSTTMFPQGPTKEGADPSATPVVDGLKRLIGEGATGFQNALSRMGNSIKEGTFLQDAWNLVTQGTSSLQQTSMVNLTTSAQAAAMALQQLAATQGAGGSGGLGNLIGSLFGGGQGPGGIGGATGGAVGMDGIPLGVYAKGGVFGGVTPFARGGAFSRLGEVLHQPTLFAFAAGGAFRRGLAGEAGPEAVMPLRRTSSGALGVMAQMSAGAAPMSVNVYNYGNDKVEVQQRQGPDGSQIMDIFIRKAKEAVASDIAEGGMVGRAVSQRTGTTPQLSRMGY